MTNEISVEISATDSLIVTYDDTSEIVVQASPLGVQGNTGATGPTPWLPPVAWAASTAYVIGPPASCVTYNGGSYVCTTAHTSNASFDATKWIMINDPGNAQSALASATNAANSASAAAATASSLSGIAPAVVTLTDAPYISWSAVIGTIFQVTLGGNRILDLPTNLIAGRSYFVRVKQDVTGSRTLAYDPIFRWTDDTAPTLSTSPYAVDVLEFVYDGVNIYGALVAKNYLAGPVAYANFTRQAYDYSTISTLSSMPSGGSISRAGNAMLYDSTGKLTYAPNNLLTYSQDFSNAAWNKVNFPVTVTGGQADPFGGTNAFKIVPTTADVGHITYQSYTVEAGVRYCMSVYVKAAGYTNIRIGSGTDGALCNFDLTSGTITSQVVALGSITAVGAGWYRVSAYYTPSASGAKTISLYVLNSSGATTYPGDGTSGVIAYGYQVEAVTYQTTPSTYVATTTAAYYGPRFDYDPSTLAAKGLLIEGTRTNLATVVTGWTLTTSSFTGTAVTGPDGSSVTPLAVTGTPTFIELASSAIAKAASALPYVYSIYIKAGSLTTSGATLRLRDSASVANRVDVAFNSQTMAITSTAGFGTFSVLTSAIAQNVGNGWYRFSFVVQTSTETSINTRLYVGGSPTGDIYLWGAQVEQASFATSFIPNGSTRAAETFAITGYSSNLINATYIDEQTGVTSMQPYNAGVAPSPSFAWLTGLRVYQNAYAGSIASPSWLSFSRAGNAIVTDSTGKLTYAPANILTYSQDFTNAAWLKNSVIITGNATTSPDGSSTATKVIEGNGGTQHIVYQLAASQQAGTYLISCYLKKAERSFAALQIATDTASNRFTVVVDLNTGAVTSTSSSGAPVGTFYNVSAIGNGWYRVSIGAVHTSSSVYLIVSPSDVGVPTFTTGLPTYSGDGVSGVYAWGAQLERVTYQTQPSAYIPTTTAAVYGPRYDYDASTTPATPRGLLIEESRTNSLISIANWSNANVTKTLNSAISPDGAYNAVKFENAVSTTTSLTQSLTAPATGAHTYSLYVKVGNGNTIGNRFLLRNTTTATNLTGIIVNYSDGSFTYSAGSTGGSVTNVGNGWWRIALTASAITTGDLITCYAGFASAVTPAIGDYFYAWGAQLEAGAFATSYIPTTSASVTRAADSPTLSGAALTAAGAATGSAIVQTSLSLYGAKNIGLLGDYSSRRLMYNGGTNTALSAYNGSVVASVAHSGWSIGPVRAAVAWDSIGFSVSANNGPTNSQGTVGAPQPMGTAASVSLGYASGYALNGWIASAAFYNQRLPDAILKSKSAVNAPY